MSFAVLQHTGSTRTRIHYIRVICSKKPVVRSGPIGSFRTLRVMCVCLCVRVCMCVKWKFPTLECGDLNCRYYKRWDEICCKLLAGRKQRRHSDDSCFKCFDPVYIVLPKLHHLFGVRPHSCELCAVLSMKYSTVESLKSTIGHAWVRRCDRPSVFDELIETDDAYTTGDATSASLHTASISSEDQSVDSAQLSAVHCVASNHYHLCRSWH